MTRLDRITQARLRLMAAKSRRLKSVRPPTRTVPPSPFRQALSRAAPDLVELGFVLILVIGVGAIFWPAALILFGGLGVIACERRSAAVKRGSRRVQEGSERVA